MERQIGEIFEHNGEWYQCVVSIDGCGECSFHAQYYCTQQSECFAGARSDGISVIFKKLEKIGEPFTCNIYGDERLVWMQEYKLYDLNFCKGNALLIYVSDYKHKRIAIEIKQNKENMEEKKLKLSQDELDWLKKQIRWAALPGYITHEEDYDRATEEIMNLFIPSDTEHSSSEKIGKNLKPFDLEAAKAGKPVCTRDGRKARIICFDLKNEQYPIVAAIGNDSSETLLCYTINGEIVKGAYKANNDLMMLP